MILHVFNPEHDISLGHNLQKYTSPRMVRVLRADFSFIPALWANKGDMVLVDNKNASKEQIKHLAKYASDVCFITPNELKLLLIEEKNKSIFNNFTIRPWGWDNKIKQELIEIGLNNNILPSKKQIDIIRELSNRKWAAQNILPRLITSIENKNCGLTVVGKSNYIDNEKFFLEKTNIPGTYVAKSPWSSSGRGIRYIMGKADHSTQGWCLNTIKNQGGILIEPLYDKLMDFGMEFYIEKQNKTIYKGLSLFHTEKGVYKGNLIASEIYKKKKLSKYVSIKSLKLIKESLLEILSSTIAKYYVGPVGIDMMIIKNVTKNKKTIAITPCVEMNLRMTMGHVALALSKNHCTPAKVMNMECENKNKYKLRIHTLTDDILNNSLL